MKKNEPSLLTRLFERTAGSAISRWGQVKDYFVLLSDETSHLVQYLIKRKGLYPGDISRQILFMGYQTLPILILITLLVGITISYTSAAQLKLFGADIYLADFVGIAMIRELIPLMTGIILAGKVGAAVTAEISSMKVLEELDALKTMGIDPVKFLMIPRLIAITVAVPLLVVTANIVGVLGGILIGYFEFGTPPASFVKQMLGVLFIKDILIELLKTTVFGWAVVVSAGYKGFSASGGTEAVGRATTESVVLSIALIIGLDCVFAFFIY
ncbi:MAG: ABC transporter permease [Acidobacteria bacterium]|nr:ABC transporter permease [Acidobacteriota bacterium]MBU4329411.1 ABC transporter permease [Acidobacteriota bacterium]MBU4495027.1 ABC transporter permease [Acidobacteriota bacterium]MCG2814648.1 ABC transporter permease [Candidatus Aminicenantes bacterium]